MRGRFYRVPFTATITAAGGDTDLCIIQPADDKPCELVGWNIGQTSEVGDAAEENVRVTIRHMTATVTVTGGTTITPVGNDPAIDAAAGCTVTTNCTTVATTSGTSRIVEEMGWNERNTPWKEWIPEEQRPKARQGEALIVRLESTLADDITFTGTFYLEEC